MDDLNYLIDSMYQRIGQAGMLLIGLKAGNPPDVHANALLQQMIENVEAEKAARLQMNHDELDANDLAKFRLLGAYVELLDSLVTQSEEIAWKKN